MKEKLVLAAKISAKSAAISLTFIVLGLLSCIICFIIGFALFSAPTDNQSRTFLATLLSDWAPALLMFSALLFVPIYFVFAHSAAIGMALHLIWQNGAGDLCESTVDRVLKKVAAKEPTWLSKIHSAADVKLKLIDTLRNDESSPAIQRRAIGFALNKIKLDDADLQQQNLNLYRVIADKLITTVATFERPTLKPLWIGITVQMVFMVVAFLFDVKR